MIRIVRNVAPTAHTRSDDADPRRNIRDVTDAVLRAARATFGVSSTAEIMSGRRPRPIIWARMHGSNQPHERTPQP